MNLQDQRVVVMGGSSGIGLATAQAAHYLGAEVLITGRDQQKLNAAAAELGEGAVAQRVDATDRPALDAFFGGLGHVDHLVLALSGGGGGGPIATLVLDDLRAGFEGKLFAHLTAVQAALPHLRSSGSLTFVTAASAGTPMAGAAGLAGINGALESMIPALAVELKPLRVNAVSPGVIDTPWWTGVPESDRAAIFARYASVSPLGRIGRSEDVAGAIVAVLGNTFITGTVLHVDGGLSLTAT